MSWFEVLDVLLCELKASPIALTLGCIDFNNLVIANPEMDAKLDSKTLLLKTPFFCRFCRVCLQSFKKC
jgi:hypothetical protein